MAVFVKFTQLCQLYEAISSTNKVNTKLDLVQQFLGKCFKGATHTDTYEFFRLLLPHLDRERQHYGIKEKNLARMFAEALMLPPKEADRLKNFKNPTKQPAG